MGMKYECILCGGPKSTKCAILCRTCENARRRNPNWHPVNYKGRWLSKGYWWVTLPGGRVREEHMVIWEQAHGRAVPKGYAVHHINEDKLDNRISNLKLLTRGEHLSRHVGGKPKPWCRYRPHDPLTGRFTR